MIPRDVAEAVADRVLIKLAMHLAARAPGERTRAKIKAAIVEACESTCGHCGADETDGRCHCTHDE